MRSLFIFRSLFWEKQYNSIGVSSLQLLILLHNFSLSNSAKSQSPSQYSNTRGVDGGTGKSSKLEEAFRPNEVIDIVGFGEDCSPKDGLFCDEIQNLICDTSLETCVCDLEKGYYHINEIQEELDFDHWEFSRKGACVKRRNHFEISESKSKNHDVDVVGWGEDCSNEEEQGPHCDESQYLTCDSKEEICVCDHTRGYIHVSDVPGGEEQHLREDLPKSLCIHKEKVSERAEQMLLGSKRKTPLANAIQEEESSGKGIYDEMIDKYAQPEQDTESLNKPDRLARFRLRRESLSGRYTGDELVLNEIVKFTYLGVMTLETIKPLLGDLLKKSATWKKNKLANSMCTAFLDLDRDSLGTPQEYAIALFSEKVRAVVMPRAFLDMIIPLPEENCITIVIEPEIRCFAFPEREDLMEWDHEPETLEMDFLAMDKNRDGCVAIDEYEQAIEDICGFNWLQTLLESVGMDDFSKNLDPSPEEMYVRMLMRNERLDANWKIVDEDKDGYISLQELTNDMALSEKGENDVGSKASALFKHIDIDEDKLISKFEFKLQMNLPSLTKDYEYDWLESLFELYETDEDEVKENLQAFERTYESIMDDAEKGILSSTKSIRKGTKRERFFQVFDKNRNGEWDEVEFKLVMEFLTKYVVYGTLNETVIKLMDHNKDGRVTLFEYREFFRNSSSTYQVVMKNLIAMEETLKDLANSRDDVEHDDIIGEMSSETDGEYDDDIDNEGDEDEMVEENDGLVTLQVSSKKLSKKAAHANETLVVYKLFLKMDENKDGFLTKEDFYRTATSYKSRKSKSEIREEFRSLDLDNDGKITSKESEDVENPTDLASFMSGYEAFTEEMVQGDFDTQFRRMDLNNDKVISKQEYDRSRNIIYEEEDENEILSWLESYLETSPPNHIVDEIGAKIFLETDSNGDGFVSPAEFKDKVEELRKTSRYFQSLSFSVPYVRGKTDAYFNSLDLNRDGVISYNEFHWLLLRPNKGIDRF